MSALKQIRLSRFYATNQIMKSPLGDRYYFALKVEILPSGMGRVIGKKYDVTTSVEALLKNARKRKAKK